MQKPIEKILVDIIKHELNLPDNYGKTTKGDIIPTVVIFGQNIKLFNISSLQVTIQTVTSRFFSNRISYEEDKAGKYFEVQDINESRMMQVDIYSKNNDARDRFWEIGAALNSTYAQQQMDLYNFKIGTIVDNRNLTGADGSSVLNRFTTTFNVLIHHQKTKQIDYYDQFKTTLDNEQGQFGDINNYNDDDTQ